MLYVGVCYGLCFLLSGYHVAAMLCNWGSVVGFAMPWPYGACPWQAYVPTSDGLWPMSGVY